MESSTLKKKAKDAFDKTTDYLSEAKDSWVISLTKPRIISARLRTRPRKVSMPPVKRCKKPTKRLKSNVPALIHVRRGHYVIAGKSGFRCEQ